MARLIDADDILPKTFICDEVAEVRKFIEQAPTVDAVEVVRCNDCKHYRTSGCAMDTYAFDVVEECFCSYGERKDND